MSSAPKPVADFLAAKRIAVAGVSRSGNAPANAILRRLEAAGHEVVPVNPNASEIEGRRCYPGIAAIDGPEPFAPAENRRHLTIKQTAQGGVVCNGSALERPVA